MSPQLGHHRLAFPLGLNLAVFESGKFVKPGDGGYINWAFIGKFQRAPNSGTVTFSKL